MVGGRDAPQTPSTQQIPTGAYFGLCHNRDRMYAPTWGRFELGVQVLGTLAYHGMPLGAMDIAPDLEGHFGAGKNVRVA